MTPTLRKATLEDLPTLLEFEKGIIEAERPFDETLMDGSFHYYDLEAFIKNPDAEVLVVEADNKIVGGGHAIVKPGKTYNRFDNYAYLGFMYIVPEYRGRGLNRLIIDGLNAWAKERGLEEVRLQVYAYNDAAIRAYEKVGFRKLLIEMRLSDS